MKTIIYYLGISTLLTHELDAVQNLEWRLLLHFFDFPERLSSTLFIALHLPLFFLFFYFSHHKTDKVRATFKLSICAFLVAHAIIHASLSGHSLYYFEGLMSNLYIYGAALFGFTYLTLHLKEASNQNC